MSIKLTLTGTYDLHKADWFEIVDPKQNISNFQRWQTAYPECQNYWPKSFNFNLANGSGSYIPPDDDTNRINAHNKGIEGNSSPINGCDILSKGSYVSQHIVVESVNGVKIRGGVLFYAGADHSFTPVMGSITRTYAEVMTLDNLDEIVPLVDGKFYEIDIVVHGKESNVFKYN